MNDFFQSILRTFRITFLNLKSNKEVCFVSIFTVAIAFSLIGLFLLVFFNLNSLLSVWSRQIQLVVYLDDNIAADDKTALESRIAGNPDIEAAAFISRETAWKNFKSTYAGKTAIVNSLDYNPLPASFNLQFKAAPERMEKIRQFAESLRQQKGVESLDYGEKWLSRFEMFMVFLRFFLLTGGGLLSLGLILIISNTIKLSIYARREEINLMVMIGARPAFVRVPFLLEGVIQGFCGALCSTVIIKGVHWYLAFQFGDAIESFFRGMNFQFLSWPLAAAMTLASMGIGWAGSWIAIENFLRSEVNE